MLVLGVETRFTPRKRPGATSPARSKLIQSSHRPTLIISRLSHQLPTNIILRKYPNVLRWQLRPREECVTKREEDGTCPIAAFHLYELSPRAASDMIFAAYFALNLLLPGPRIESLATG